MSNSTPTHSPKIISKRKKEKKNRERREENQEIGPIVHAEREREIGRDRGQRARRQRQRSPIDLI